MHVDPGFQAANLLTMQITLPPRHAGSTQGLAFYAELLGRLERLDGVTAVGGTTRLPLGSTNVSTKVVVEGRTLPPAEWPEVEFRRAIHDYFEAMGIPVLRGRSFTADDGPAAPRVAVINQAMARRVFGGEDPIGRRVRFGSETAALTTIVGVIGDIRHSGLETAPVAEAYIHYLQGPPVNPFLVLRTTGDPTALVPAVRAQLQSVDKDIAAYDIRSMSDVRAESVSQRRFILLLAGTFGLLALAMSMVGVYGVMALIVSERTKEIGVRLALGATPARVLRAVIGQGVALASGGVAAGLAAAVLLMPLLSSQLFGIGVADPVTLIGVPLLLLAVAVLACYAPARRAMRIEPVAALRQE
jgi:putative ABC transport system permease protein